ncbi:hypothetical protein QA640_45870 (plasmid) [Bradyrhizobium sp. CB82]|uniref:hypothetical protein n=1 Tax=Bradyrhizobium sp. CB82 TaxID=3039159 RepID=UPI0024B144D4|nr:hypothetical protein [Bradyrhizobium sp. CB82]WFU46088.1 hypothetical protein QA640_45870 [Bradyrhizobium sp. CB82]
MLSDREAEMLINSLRMDRCPDCQHHLQSGARGGAAQILTCTHCGASFSVAPPRYITFVRRLK